MCAIIAWSGKLPKGLLFQLLEGAQVRGRDSTGMAYWDTDRQQNMLVKQAATATQFIKANAPRVSTAQNAPRGIAHTRRASPNMPIDNDNAHPFIYGSYAFAHNGSIRQWKEHKKWLIDKISDSMLYIPPNTAEYLALQNKLRCVGTANTDSILLGPHIESRDFSNVTGSIGLAWLHGPTVMVFRTRQDLTAAKIEWSKPGSTDTSTAYVAASTWPIIATALNRIQNCQYDANEILLAEGTLYELTPAGIVDNGQLPTHKENARDAFTSTSELPTWPV